MQPLVTASNSLYICPVCREPLQLQPSGKNYACLHHHSFDLAKEGYLNLLPVQDKHSKEPGDSKLMMIARRLFLEAGFYEPMAKAVAMMIDAGNTKGQGMQLLDLGCGEGYYSRKIACFCKHGEQIALQGIDIAKFAIAAAAKNSPKQSLSLPAQTGCPMQTSFLMLYSECLHPRIMTSSSGC